MTLEGRRALSQRNQQHMMILREHRTLPTLPTAHLVMIHPDFAFGFFKDRFDGPSHSADANELIQRSVDGSIAEKEFDLSRVIQITADDQPEFTGRQTSARFGHAQKCEITNDGTFAAFFDHGLNPILLLNLLQQLLDWNGTLPDIAEMQASGTTSMTTPLRKMNLGRSTPDQAVLFDGCEVRLSRSRHTVPKRRTVSIQSVCRHPGKRQIIALDGAFQQFQPDFWLRFENQILRDSAGLPLLAMFFCKPWIGHEQLSFDQTVSLATGISQIHSDLPVRDLSHRTAVLRSYPDRFSSL